MPRLDPAHPKGGGKGSPPCRGSTQHTPREGGRAPPRAEARPSTPQGRGEGIPPVPRLDPAHPKGGGKGSPPVPGLVPAHPKGEDKGSPPVPRLVPTHPKGAPCRGSSQHTPREGRGRGAVAPPLQSSQFAFARPIQFVYVIAHPFWTRPPFWLNFGRLASVGCELVRS